MPPKVSILLPNLNNRPYLEERIRTIMSQTFRDWELIIVDNYSDDGAWEFFKEWAKKDSRINISQAPRKGMYANWNNCIRLAKGEYIYIATSDDTMIPHFLERMVDALDEHPECDLAHCKLRIIDEDNNISNQKLWDNFFTVRYFGDLINQTHIRKAPHDGVLHFSGITVYTSITQLLIRGSLFARIGLFLENYGSMADYEWVMRATLVADTVHIPEYLATWRLHSVQATSDDRTNTAKASGKFIKMADHAVSTAGKLNPAVINRLNIKKLKYILEKEKFYHEIKCSKNQFRKRWILFKWLLVNPGLVFEFKKAKEEKKNFVSQADFLEYIKEMIKEHDLEKNLSVIIGNSIINYDT
jgi:glycosyltransferase involved in cell wall biosynthesis